MIKFRQYKRLVPTRARILTEEDMNTYKGIISSPEGDVPFAVDDYLARDVKGIWPIKRNDIVRYYDQVAPPDEDGFASYLRRGICVAAQMPEPFIIAGLSGQAGDYLVINNDSGWPVNQEMFEATYMLIEDENADS